MAGYKPKYGKKIPKTGRALPVVYVVLLLVLAASSIWGVSARYTRETTSSGVVVAEKFGVSSNYLVEGGRHYFLNPGIGTITVTLENNTETDAVYVIAASTGATIDGASQGTIAGNGTVSLNVKGLQPGQTYTVSAVCEAGYRTILQATFEVKTANAAAYYYIDETDPACYLLTVWTENVEGQVTISLPAGLVPDVTDSELTGISNFSDGSYGAINKSLPVNLAKYASRTYRFFKDPAYVGGAVSVSVGSVPATHKVP